MSGVAAVLNSSNYETYSMHKKIILMNGLLCLCEWCRWGKNVVLTGLEQRVNYFSHFRTCTLCTGGRASYSRHVLCFSQGTS